MNHIIYFDNSASTPVDPRVVEAMKPYWIEVCGNASSLHSAGRLAKDAMEDSRASLARLIHAEPEEIIFTSSGTEANNFALKSVAFTNREKGNHVIVSAVEHDCVLNASRWLERQGFEVTYLPVDGEGFVDPDDVRKAIRKETLIVSVMHANNEIGTIEPIEEIGKICREHNVYFHTDACQSFGKFPIDVRKQNIDLMTLNAHKIYGPKGVGALFIRNGVKIEAWQHGGGHERGLRSATENIPGIVGFAKAAELCHDDMPGQVSGLVRLRDKIIETVSHELPFAYLNGPRYRRLCNHINFSFAGYEGEGIRLLLELDKLGFAVSAGSACSSNDAENKPSHVLLAIGRNPFQARGALRISLGRFNTEAEVDQFLSVLPGVVKNLNSISSATSRK
jgi:cysteine desulfurase